MFKHIATVGGVGIAVAFVVVFFAGRAQTRHLAEFAPRVGLSHEELLALGPRVAARTGATLGSSRRVVFLLSCTGLATRATLEVQANQAASLAFKERLTDREAVSAVLIQASPASAATAVERLKGC